jgi:hypothetical protein
MVALRGVLSLNDRIFNNGLRLDHVNREGSPALLAQRGKIRLASTLNEVCFEQYAPKSVASRAGVMLFRRFLQLM